MTDGLSFAEAGPISRRTFLSACSTLALTASGCVVSLDNARLSYLALNEPEPAVYLPVLHALVETILPFDHPRFPPVPPAVIQQRVLDLFPFDGSDDALALRRALTIFNDLRLFAAAPAALVAQEHNELDLHDAARHAKLIAAVRATDAALDGAFRDRVQPRADTFVGLPPLGRLACLQMWSRSGFSIRRRFYHSAKAIVMVTAWSMDVMWPPIGYGGPLASGA